MCSDTTDDPGVRAEIEYANPETALRAFRWIRAKTNKEPFLRGRVVVVRFDSTTPHSQILALSHFVDSELGLDR
jgi:hypothetical protein